MLYCKPQHAFYDLAADIMAENSDLVATSLSKVSLSHLHCQNVDSIKQNLRCAGFHILAQCPHGFDFHFTLMHFCVCSELEHSSAVPSSCGRPAADSSSTDSVPYTLSMAKYYTLTSEGIGLAYIGFLLIVLPRLVECEAPQHVSHSFQPSRLGVARVSKGGPFRAAAHKLVTQLQAAALLSVQNMLYCM